jgi:hypothetical protein
LAELQKFGWDSNAELLQIKPEHIVKILEKYLIGKINTKEVEDWANALECREDLGFSSEKRDVIREAIFQLANPLLNEPISSELASSLKIQLLQ